MKIVEVNIDGITKIKNVTLGPTKYVEVTTDYASLGGESKYETRQFLTSDWEVIKETGVYIR